MKLAEFLGLERKFFYKNRYLGIIRYKTSKIPKKGGGEREINNPCPPLKRIQGKILYHLSRIYMPSWLISGRKGLSYIDNGRFHSAPKSVVTLDIKDFFPHCSRGKVYKMFLEEFRMSQDLARIMTDLVTFNNCVPQGSPASQIIAFFTYYNVFIRINNISEFYKCTFSLYVDDMTFSSESEISKALLQDVSSELKKVGLSIKWKKAKRYRNGQCKLITGVVIDAEGDIRVSNALRKKVITGIHKIKEGLLSTEELQKEKRSLFGRIISAKMIEPKVFSSIQREIK